MPNTIKFSNNPNEDTAFVTMEDDTRTRAVLTVPVDGTVKFSDNPNSTKVKVTVDGEDHMAVAVYNLAGGSDGHNKGYYADQEALEEAYPTGEAGDYAVVGDTDTIWIWDEDTSAWVDSDQKGQVTSVNNQTGDVTITASDLGALVNNATGTDALSILGGATSQAKAIAIGKDASVTQSYGIAIGSYLTRSAGGIAIGAAAQTSGAGIAIGDNNPQALAGSGNSAIAIGAKQKATAAGAIQIGTNQASAYTNADANTFKVSNASGNFEIMSADGSIPSDRLTHAINKYSSMPTAASTNEGQIVQFTGTTDANYTHGYIYESIATTTASSATASQTAGSSLTDVAVVVATFETQITTSGSYVFTSDGADWSYDGNVVDLTDYGITYTGTPVADDAITVVYTAESTSYAWGQVDVQPAPSGLPDQTGQSGKFLTTDGTDASWSDKPLVNQKDLSTTNSIVVLYSGQQPTRVGSHCIVFGGGDFTNTSDYVIKIGGSGRGAGSYSTQVGYATGPSGVRPVTYGVCVGYQSRVGKTTGTGVGNIAIGASTTSFENYTITIGYNTAALAQGAIQIGHYEDPNNPDTRTENSDANTFKVANANGNFEIMSADGTVPTDRFTTTPTTDGTYVPTLTISSGVATRTWAAPASGTSSISVTLPAADWVNDEQTVTATGVTASNTVIVGAAPASASEYNTSGVICTAQGADSLTFSCSTTPSNDLTVTVLIF